jgi:hypothetical protein
LFYIVWRIVRGRSNAWLININAITALVLLYPCCFINFDGMIASFNARHCEEVGGGGSPLDIAYFQDLGAPALPALDGVRDHLVGDARQQWAKAVSVGLHAQLDADLNDWHAWTWRRARSARAADEINTQLAKARAAASEQLAQVPSLKGAGASASASASAASAAAAAIVATPETIETSH